MSEFRDRQIGELSGGQKKRVFLARALAQEGRIILLDEPFTGVDVKTEEAIIELLRELRAAGPHHAASRPTISAACPNSATRSCWSTAPCSPPARPRGLHRGKSSGAFGGVLRHFQFDQSTIQDDDGRAVTVLTDDERPLVFGKDGHLEYKDRGEHEELLKQRSEEHE